MSRTQTGTGKIHDAFRAALAGAAGWRRAGLLVAVFLPAGCTLPSAPWRSAADGPPSPERLAAEVVIHRDAFGVPHIHGRTDEAVVFGVGYAQAEDNLWQVEEDFLHALGWASYVHGETMLVHDLVRAAFDVERLARDEYLAQPPELRRLLDAFTAGINYFIARHPHRRPRVLLRMEPWYPLAVVRSASPATVVNGVRLGEIAALLGVAGGNAPVSPGVGETGGSSAWAIAPSRTAGGSALLLQSPHLTFFGTGQPYEMRVASDEGWSFAGFARLATPFPRAGHNDHLAWSHTSGGSDAADAWTLDFSHPSDPLLYRHGEEWRAAEERVVTIRVNTHAGVTRREFRIVSTHHGPVVAQRDGRAVAVRLARFDEGGSLAQWYAMGRASDLDEFTAALEQRALAGLNTMYADAAGNILYLHGNAVPRRDARLDWSAPLDGTDVASDWNGLHELAELPQLLNPESGWIQSSGATPFLASAFADNPEPSAFPDYMAPEPDNARARAARRILLAGDGWTLDALGAAAFDTRAIEAEDFVAGLVDEWERLGVLEPERALRVERFVDALREWDQRVHVESVPATHFLLALRQHNTAAPVAAEASSGEAGGVPRVRALEAALDELRGEWGTEAVPWGEMNRLQRVHSRSREGFRDYAPSLPIAGAPGWAGVIFDFRTSREPSQRRRYGTSGPAWVAVVKLADPPAARSIVQFGQTADPASPHYFDQAPLYADGRFKPVHHGVAAFRDAAVHSYRPGPALAGESAAAGLP